MTQPDASVGPLSATDFHILMVLDQGDSYGYAIMKAVEADSEGTVAPGIGSLYRILARLTSAGLVSEAPTPDEAPTEHRGHPRQYYCLTGTGRDALKLESLRLEGLVRLARARKLLPHPSK